MQMEEKTQLFRRALKKQTDILVQVLSASVLSYFFLIFNLFRTACNEGNTDNLTRICQHLIW